MISISLCMIVKNEHDTLERCLNSIKDFADEIIIVDTGSSDDTKEIAKKFTDKVYDFKWCDDFAKARNFSFSKATKEYIMWLDADDVVLKEDLEKLLVLKNILSRDVDMVLLKYNLNLDENGIPALSFYRERIVKRAKNFKWISPIHEVIPQSGNIIREDIAVTHKKLHASDPKRNLRIFENMKKNNYPFDARQLFYYARELMYDKRFEESILVYNEFFERKDAWVENIISACLDLYGIYIELDDKPNALKSLFKSFEYDTPRAEICCSIGKFFEASGKYNLAIYWFNRALESNYDISAGGFYIKDCYDFFPYLELSVCYYYLGDLELAIKYNKLAGNIKPNDINVLNNSNFFNATV